MTHPPHEPKPNVQAVKTLLTTLKDAALQGTSFPFTQTEDDLHQSFRQTACPYGICEEGKGYFQERRGAQLVTVRCQCFKDYQIRMRLLASRIQPNFWDVSLSDLSAIDDKIHITHLQPKAQQLEAPPPKTAKKTAASKKPAPASFFTKKKTVEDQENPHSFVERTYDVKPIQKGVSYFAVHYTEKVLSLLGESPRKQTLNLLLLGDPGKGKTHLACAVAKEFMTRGKTVSFTRMRSLLDEAFEHKSDIRKLVRQTELLIIDELGQEYHTDTQWALKQIQDLFKERQETGLPTIVTTNFFPNELASLYGESLLSTFHGRFLMMIMHGDYDLRTLQAIQTFESLDFLQD